MLRLRSEADLGNLGLPPSLLEQARQQLAPQIQIPDIGDLSGWSDDQLWAKVEQEQSAIRRVEKEICERGLYLTAARYRRGLLLAELKLRCGHGAFEKECKARKIKSQRASEDMRIAEYFPSEAEAGKVPVTQALKMISDAGDPNRDMGGASTPDWLIQICNQLAIAACDHPLSLDVAAAKWNHKCDRYFTEKENGLSKTWDAPAVWCNPPYSRPIIEAFVGKAIEEKERGTTTLLLIPWWSFDYLTLCERHGRIHRIVGPVIFQLENGAHTALNRASGTSSVIVVIIGPNVSPGPGDPISKTKATAEAVEHAERMGSRPAMRNGDHRHAHLASAEVAEDMLAVPSPTGDAKDLDLQNTETPPSLVQWVFKRLADAGVHPNTILDPCAGHGNLTRPFRPRSQVIEYEISLGRDFFGAKEVACDLVICNPPWKEALRWLQQIVKIVGNRTPIVFICPVLFFIGYKTAPCRQYLESPAAPALHHITPLPADTFVKVYCPGAILWLNLPAMRDVALVPSPNLIRSNNNDQDQ